MAASPGDPARQPRARHRAGRAGDRPPRHPRRRHAREHRRGQLVGTDPDGYVVGYELRYFDAARPRPVGAEVGWLATTRRDTTSLLPIPPGNPIGRRRLRGARPRQRRRSKTPSPRGRSSPSATRRRRSASAAPRRRRTRRGPPPPSPSRPTTPTARNLAGIEVALNDTLAGFLRLPADVDFITLVADDPRAAETEARVLLGRDGSTSVPRSRPAARRVEYALPPRRRCGRVHQPDGASTPSGPRPDVVRAARHERDAAGQRLPDREGTPRPARTTANPRQLRGAALRRVVPLRALPDGLHASSRPTATTCRRTRADAPRRRSASGTTSTGSRNNATNRSVGNNLPSRGGVLDAFFGQGGRPLHQRPRAAADHARGQHRQQALALLPLADLLDFGPGMSTRSTPSVDLDPGAALVPAEPLPGGVTLPALKTTRAIAARSATPSRSGRIAALHREPSRRPRHGGERVHWPGPSVVASMRADGRVALFGLPLVSDLTGKPSSSGSRRRRRRPPRGRPPHPRRHGLPPVIRMRPPTPDPAPRGPCVPR